MCCAGWGALLLQVAKSGTPFLRSSVERITNFLYSFHISFFFTSSQNRLFVSLWGHVQILHCSMPSSETQCPGISWTSCRSYLSMNWIVTARHQFGAWRTERSNAWAGAFQTHQNHHFSTAFFCGIRAPFRTFLSTLCGNGFLKMWMRWDTDESHLPWDLLTSDISQVLPRIWGNLSDLYSGRGMFTLAV